MEQKIFLLVMGFLSYCNLSTNAMAISRVDILSNGTPYTQIIWSCDSANHYDSAHNYTSKFQIGESYMGEAYCWGGWDTWATFIDRLQVGATASCCTSGYGNASGWATGTDCSGYVSRCLTCPHC